MKHVICTDTWQELSYVIAAVVTVVTSPSCLIPFCAWPRWGRPSGGRLSWPWPLPATAAVPAISRRGCKTPRWSLNYGFVTPLLCCRYCCCFLSLLSFLSFSSLLCFLLQLLLLLFLLLPVAKGHFPFLQGRGTVTEASAILRFLIPDIAIAIVPYASTIALKIVSVTP